MAVQTWQTQDPLQRDWSKGGIQYQAPTYTTHTLSTGPDALPMPGSAPAATPAPQPAPPISGASMAPAFNVAGAMGGPAGLATAAPYKPTTPPTTAQEGLKAGDIYNKNINLDPFSQQPIGAPKPTTTPAATPPPKKGWDYFKNLFSTPQFV